MTTSTETHQFQSEARQLLQLMVHSIYSNKDVFLRELVSNASDALDKLRLETYQDKELEADTSDLHIELELDRAARTLTVRDNGIGMTRDEVVSLIGTIAKSGTAELLAKLRETKDAAASADLIGQFGVGFYATFMVADRVTLVTRRAGAGEGVRWESAGEGTYTIEPAADAPQGTAVTLHLKPEDTEDNLHDYADPAKVRQIIKHYSDFITWPIKMAKPAEDTTEDTGEDTAEDTELETVNSMKALWARSASDVSSDELTEFYRHVSHDWNPPLETVRLQAEGTFEYQALLFIPSRAPFDLFMREAKRGIQLYVKRVFIMDDCEELVPEYLRFVKGVVDAQDLSLNVSREILQQDRQIQLIRRRLVKKVLSALKALPAEKYATFWGEFAKVMKEGLVADPDNRDAILDLCSFASTHDAERLTTLREYVERMKDNQQHIYYLTGESRSSIESSPHMEAFQAKGFEVLVLTDPIDEMWVEAVSGFEGKELHSVAKGQVDLDDEADKEAAGAERAEREKDFASLLEWMGTTLADTVKEVRLSARLTTSPACVVGDEHDITPTLEKMYRAMGQELPQVKRILEVNPTHPLIAGLRTAHAARGEDAELAETAHLVHDMAILAEGGELADPARFVKLVAKRLEQHVG
ncbi:MAG: molecular chaperone HtpG [Actinophytocola sp.]|uniref:molecular chaperone HtpG n=1 Tax=Actinophytocola sp. TaxID=1872138 RepID=UPI003D6BC0A5